MKVVTAILGFFAGAGIGAYVEGMEETPRMLIASICFGFTAVCVLIVMSNYWFKKLWPGKVDWQRSSSEDRIPVRGAKCDEWESKGYQTAGDSILVKMNKRRSKMRWYAFKIIYNVFHKTILINESA